MKKYEQQHDDILEDITQMLEKESEKKIFTIRVLEEVEEGLNSIIVFEDRSVLKAVIYIEEVDGKLAVRLQGNYI